jgi:hypothetical protein
MTCSITHIALIVGGIVAFSIVGMSLVGLIAQAMSRPRETGGRRR